MDVKGSRLEQQAQSIEKTIPSKSSTNAQLEATIKSAELYLQALRLVDKPSDRKRLDVKCKELLGQAEKLKQRQDGFSKSISKPQPKEALKVPLSSRKLTTRENIIILEGSKLNGFIFKPWTSAPSADEFSLQDGQEPFTDSSPLPLSPDQLETFGGWKRADDAISSSDHRTDDQSSSNEVVMHSNEPMDLVQDLTSDCSVVASLCACTSRVERGHPKVGQSRLHDG
jgi:hypothetical protein